ncbi:zinc finger protein 488 isoform X1 [Latimeria chalumnae]|uniref:zinc finger protein 488 isoform X1 n=2 Tax=Latimeria chalumnae TaxID=7897 RepID=UPI00313C1A61
MGSMMELTSLSKTLWANDSKLLHHHFTDVFTTVHTTRDILEGSIFGPCILQNTFYDTIAFIALKCTEKRSNPYVFRVDTAIMNGSSSGLSWLRLVQAANNTKEQNLEAYLKNGQFYYRSTRKISKDEELLVWYDSELSHLLGFTDIKTRTLPGGFRCSECDQIFKFENPYLAHVRFLCVLWKDNVLLGRHSQGRKTTEKNSVVATNFHNLGRDLEVHSTRKDEALSSAERKRKAEDIEDTKIRKTVLLEKTNNLGNDQTCGDHEEPAEAPLLAASLRRLNWGKCLFRKDASEHKESAFTEFKRTKEKAKQEKTTGSEESSLVQFGKEHLGADSISSSSGSAFSFVLPTCVRGDQKSAFFKPTRRVLDRSTITHSQPLSDSSDNLRDLSDSITKHSILGYGGSLLSSKFVASDFASSQLLPSAPRGNPFPYNTEIWPKNIGVQLQTTSSLTLLPPSFTSFGVAAQNWCAKCNLSFRMTSDLVFHMRSHHKKEYSNEYQCKRRREDKLTCPICHEYFRERHHLSRHMTSHN